jgi:hypothetical protein
VLHTWIRFHKRNTQLTLKLKKEKKVKGICHPGVVSMPNPLDILFVLQN